MTDTIDAILSNDAPADSAMEDPHLWLERWEDPEVLAWVAAQNERTLSRLQGNPRYPAVFDAALAIASADDRIAMPSRSFGRIYNFWQDRQRPQGVWRWTTAESYATAHPEWTVALDLDALSLAEGTKWVWKGATLRTAQDRRCMVALSDGGEDAVVYREFDLADQAFVANGFLLPRSKQGVAWLDADTLLVSRDWGEGSMTASGYPFVIKAVRRGQPIASATELFRGAPDDQLGTYAVVLRDARENRTVLIVRHRSFFCSQTLVWTPWASAVVLPIPDRATPVGMIDGRILFKTDDDWQDVPAGALASVSLADIAGGPIVPTLVFAPTGRQAFEGAVAMRSRLAVFYTDTVRGRVDVFAPVDGGWSRRPLALPDYRSFSIAGSSIEDDRAYLVASGFLSPTTLSAIDFATDAPPVPAKALPAKFAATALVVEQHEATSSDGERVPYFMVRHADAPRDGSVPTLLNAYGGFGISQTPAYSGLTGKLWLERGGAYVLANIRGGGEFGPAWHDAGRKTKRQLIYDDFVAVAQDLFARGFTSPERLGIYGGSNGGLLMGVAMTQRPDLWRAVTIQVPLLDMLRYERIAAGPSWVDEFGSVSVPEERAFLAAISPYHNLKPDTAYPEPFVWTTIKDDRVGPQHARKFAARMAEFGLPYLFYEDGAGGHSGDADIEQVARVQSLQAVYFIDRLMGPDAARPTDGTR